MILADTNVIIDFWDNPNIVAVQAPHSLKVDKLPRLNGNFITPAIFIIVKLDEAVFHHGFFD